MEEKKAVPISYRKSFLAKYILSDDRCKEVYQKLKNKLLSIEGCKSRTSWFYDAFNIGRINFAKLSVRGKYVALYLNLKIEDYEENIYHQEFVGDRRRFGDTSFKIHVKSNRSLKYAFKLIDDEIKNFDLKTGRIPNENYYLPYENELALIQRGLIKLSDVKVDGLDRYNVEESLAFDPYENKGKDEKFSEDYTKQVIFVDGSKVFVKERKSFEAKLIQASVEVQNYYSIIKNQLLSFKKVSSRTSWKYESFNLGRTKLAKIQIRGKYLVLYLNLDLKKYPERRGYEDASKYKLFEDTPLSYRVKNDKRLEKALELIQDLKKRFLLEEGFIKDNHEYSVGFEDSDELKAKGLIKVYAKFGEKGNKELEDLESKVLSRRKNNFIVYKEEKRLMLSIDANNNFIQKEEIVKIPVDGKKEIVYLDVLEKEFNENELINLSSLIEKGLIDSDTDFYKVIYRGGQLKKKLNIVASAESQAVKKIVEEQGGSYKVEV